MPAAFEEIRRQLARSSRPAGVHLSAEPALSSRSPVPCFAAPAKIPRDNTQAASRPTGQTYPSRRDTASSAGAFFLYTGRIRTGSLARCLQQGTKKRPALNRQRGALFLITYTAARGSLYIFAFANQPLPSTRREIISAEQVSPVALTIVAAGSTRKPIVAMIGKASGGKP